MPTGYPGSADLKPCARHGCLKRAKNPRGRFCSQACFNLARREYAATSKRKPNDGFKAFAINHKRPNGQTVVLATKDQPSESWWARFATGPRDGFYAEAIQRAPLMKPDNVRLKIWSTE